TDQLALGQSGAGSRGGIGDAAAAGATAMNTVTVTGASSYALFGQSATGNGNSGAVNLVAQESLFARGGDSVAVYGESSASGGKGNISMALNGDYTIGGDGTGVGAMIVGGADNTLVNNSVLFTLGLPPISALALEGVPGSLAAMLDDLSPEPPTGPGDPPMRNTIFATFGDDVILNELGRVIGNVDLGTGINRFENGASASMVATQQILLGEDGLYLNEGLFTNSGIGKIRNLEAGGPAPAAYAVDLTGGFEQAASGSFVTDIDLDTQLTDRLNISGTGDFDGTAPLNFLSIDKLFERYTIARAEDGMTADGFTPTFRPTVGFDFTSTVENGTDLVLFAEKPSFISLAQDPASGTTDSNVFALADYFDGLEAASSPENPMARLINMLRFLPDEQTLGETLTRLTPSYAVHSFELMNRSTAQVLDAGRDCGGRAQDEDPLARCVWFSISPNLRYERDAGDGATDRDDKLQVISLGGRFEVSDNWSLGGVVAHTSYESDISMGDALLSSTEGSGWQGYALAKYSAGSFFADFLVGGGTAEFSGQRDTTVQQVESTPGETLEGVYLPDILLPGIGNQVTYTQDGEQFALSTKAGVNYRFGSFYLEPSLQVDARWSSISGEETGSLAAFTFDGSSGWFFSATPGLELGTEFAVARNVDLRLFVNGGIELSNHSWELEGGFTAAAELDAPLLRLTEDVDSPLYKVGLGAEILSSEGVKLGVSYDGAFGDLTTQHSFAGRLGFQF
ncbi:autotransporter outer membrane beta-barrel domain-containing protein, partial [Terrihabitans rhizophilus]